MRINASYYLLLLGFLGKCPVMCQRITASLFFLLLLAALASHAQEQEFPVPQIVWSDKSEISLDELRRDVTRGDAEAMKNLGVRYHMGDGVPQDYKEAMRLYLAASDKGNKAAPAIIALMYEDGLGVERDYQQAMRWSKLGHRRSSAVAASRIGTIFQYGYGIKIDYAEAMRWYRIADRRGLDEAANNIGNLYDHGLGVKQDLTEALRWYLKAMKGGSHAAANNIGSLYQFGRGVPQDCPTKNKSCREWELQPKDGSHFHQRCSAIYRIYIYICSSSKKYMG